MHRLHKAVSGLAHHSRSLPGSSSRTSASWIRSLGITFEGLDHSRFPARAKSITSARLFRADAVHEEPALRLDASYATPEVSIRVAGFERVFVHGTHAAQNAVHFQEIASRESFRAFEGCAGLARRPGASRVSPWSVMAADAQGEISSISAASKKIARRLSGRFWV